MVRKRSNWCGAFGWLVVKHLLVAGQKRPRIAVFTPLRSDFRAMDAHFECPAVHHLLYGALAAMDDFRKATPFVHVPKHAGKHDLVVEVTPPTDDDSQGVGVPLAPHSTSVQAIVSCNEPGAVGLIVRDGARQANADIGRHRRFHGE